MSSMGPGASVLYLIAKKTLPIIEKKIIKHRYGHDLVCVPPGGGHFRKFLRILYVG